MADEIFKVGGNGKNGRIMAFSDDGVPVIQLIVAGSSVHVQAGHKKRSGDLSLTGSPGGGITIHLNAADGSLHVGGSKVDGSITLSDAKGKKVIHITASNGFVAAGGGGVNGTFSTRGKDGKPVVELLARDDESIIGLGQTGGRPGRISMYDGNGKESIKLDAAAGDIVLLKADCAEEFDSEEDVTPGSVVVLTESQTVRCCDSPHDTRVLGVVSGAGGFRPGLILDRQETSRTRVPVAFMGKVFCWADASRAPIRVGDLLTTSARTGHAMKAENGERIVGSLLGKALGSLDSGTGLVPIVVALQ